MRHLEFSGADVGKNFQRNREHIEDFTSNFLRVDGVFVLRMVAAHAGVIFCSELTNSVWNRYLIRQIQLETANFDNFEFRDSWEDFPSPPTPLIKRDTFVFEGTSSEEPGRVIPVIIPRRSREPKTVTPRELLMHK